CWIAATLLRSAPGGRSAGPAPGWRAGRTGSTVGSLHGFLRRPGRPVAVCSWGRHGVRRGRVTQRSPRMKAEPAGALRMLAVVPVLNEAARIADCLAPLRAAGARVLVADGGSTDDTVALAQAAGAEVLRAPKGR